MTDNAAHLCVGHPGVRPQLALVITLTGSQVGDLSQGMQYGSAAACSFCSMDGCGVVQGAYMRILGYAVLQVVIQSPDVVVRCWKSGD